MGASMPLQSVATRRVPPKGSVTNGPTATSAEPPRGETALVAISSDAGALDVAEAVVLTGSPAGQLLANAGVDILALLRH